MKLAQFGKDTRGSVAVIVGLLAVILFVVGGGAIDLAVASYRKDMLQQNIDAAAKAGLLEAEDADSETIAKKFVNLYPLPPGMDTPVFTVTATTVNGNRRVDVTVDTAVETRFLKLFKIPRLNISAAARTERNLVSMEIVIAADVTRSMVNDIGALRDAATALVNAVYDEAEKDPRIQVSVSIIPFSDDINLGTRYYSSATNFAPVPWLTQPLDGHNACVCPAQYIVPTPCPGEGNTVVGSCAKCLQNGVCGLPEHWRGCTLVRSGVYRTNISNVTTNRYPVRILPDYFTDAAVENLCGPVISYLQKTKSTVQDSINALRVRTRGYTYLPSGLIWGWNMLTNEDPINDASSIQVANRDGIRKILVLMSDGGNTIAPNAGGGFSNRIGAADILEANADTATTCTNMKADPNQIRIFTVLFRETDQTISDMFAACASSPNDFQTPGTKDELINAFKNIAAAIQGIRLTK